MCLLPFPRDAHHWIKKSLLVAGIDLSLPSQVIAGPRVLSVSPAAISKVTLLTHDLQGTRQTGFGVRTQAFGFSAQWAGGCHPTHPNGSGTGLQHLPKGEHHSGKCQGCQGLSRRIKSTVTINRRWIWEWINIHELAFLPNIRMCDFTWRSLLTYKILPYGWIPCPLIGCSPTPQLRVKSSFG